MCKLILSPERQATTSCLNQCIRLPKEKSWWACKSETHIAVGPDKTEVMDCLGNAVVFSRRGARFCLGGGGGVFGFKDISELKRI
jgi:hypothetical protein